MPGLTAAALRAPGSPTIKLKTSGTTTRTTCYVQTDKVRQLIREGEEGWEQYVPAEVAVMIKERCLFGYHCEVKK